MSLRGGPSNRPRSFCLWKKGQDVFCAFFVLGVAFLSGCATIPQPDAPGAQVVPQEGIYHKVRGGETLWRIAQSYGVSLPELIRSNRIPDAARIEKGQLVFIPGATKTIEIAHPNDDPNKNEFAWPLRGKVVSYFADSRGYLSKGIVIQAQEGTGVLASRQGKVVFSDDLSGYGATVILDHQDGFLTVYALNAEIEAKLGEFVYKGDRIARVGRRGVSPSLYFEVRRDGSANNPLYYLPK